MSIGRSGDTPALCAGRGDPQFRRDSEGLERVQRRITQLGKGLEHKDWLKELWGLSLEKKRLEGNLSAFFNFLTGEWS